MGRCLGKSRSHEHRTAIQLAGNNLSDKCCGQMGNFERRLATYMWAISGTNGSSGLGSVNSEQIESSTCTEKTSVNTVVPHNSPEDQRVAC